MHRQVQTVLLLQFGLSVQNDHWLTVSAMVVQMLDTAFHKEKPSLLKKTRMRALSKSQNKMWSYVGRFLWGFTMVEYELDQLCHQLLSPDFLDQEDDDSRKKSTALVMPLVST